MTKNQQRNAVAISAGFVVLSAVSSLLLNTADDDASMAGGFALLVLTVLSLPWSVLVYVSDVSDSTYTLLTAALALVNLGLIVGVVRWLTARRDRTGQSASHPAG